MRSLLLAAALTLTGCMHAIQPPVQYAASMPPQAQKAPLYRICWRLQDSVHCGTAQPQPQAEAAVLKALWAWPRIPPLGGADAMRGDPVVFLPKSLLVHGVYYTGKCRNASVARWDATQQVFHYHRTKFGSTFQETAPHLEDERPPFDVFFPFTEIDYSVPEIEMRRL